MSASHVADSFGARIPIRIVLVLACLLAAGCADPPAVKRFAAASSAAGEKFPEISKDIKESCARREEYRLVGRWDADLDSLERVTAGTCAPYGRTVSRLNKSHAVLMEYMKALGSLSAGELVNYDKPVGDLGDALGDIAPDEATRIAAAEGISSVIAEAVAGKWRRKELGRTIEDANADVQTLAGALCESIEKDYSRLLDAETEAARKFYMSVIREHRDEEPLTAILLYDRWIGEKKKIEARRETARGYVKVLKKIARGHQDLYDHRGELKSKDVRKLVLQHAAAIEDLAAELGRAF
jgi:hypothetical protein